jgi:hypothetical protein
MLEEIRELGATEQVTLKTQYRKLNFLIPPMNPPQNFAQNTNILHF